MTGSSSSSEDRARARRIVRRAAGLSESARSWLHDDPRGFWEQQALEYLERAASEPAAQSMTEDEIDGEIAHALVRLAILALLRDARG